MGILTHLRGAFLFIYAMLKNMILFLLSVALITCFFSFIVQFLVYLRYRSTNNPLVRDQKSVVEYLSGVIGDGLLMPLTNVFAVLTLLAVGFNPSLKLFLASALVGMFVTWVFHYGQQKFKLTNWTMPKVGQWNYLGLYHALFMFAEISFLSLVLIETVYSVWKTESINHFIMPFIGSWAMLALFAGTFFYDYAFVFKRLKKLPTKQKR